VGHLLGAVERAVEQGGEYAPAVGVVGGEDGAGPAVVGAERGGGFDQAGADAFAAVAARDGEAADRADGFRGGALGFAGWGIGGGKDAAEDDGADDIVAEHGDENGVVGPRGAIAVAVLLEPGPADALGEVDVPRAHGADDEQGGHDDAREGGADGGVGGGRAVGEEGECGAEEEDEQGPGDWVEDDG
jgi:hypothetical protein